LRIVIISCSGKKKCFPKAAPALEVYDGPYYKTIRKLKKEGQLSDDVKILIISAKYGLLALSDPIEMYDEKISQKSATELNSTILVKLANEISEQCEELVINLGKDYLPAIEGIDKVLPHTCKIKRIDGTIIQRRQKLKEYLIHE